MTIECLKRVLAHSAFPAVLVALALVLSAPAWRLAFSGDDLVQAGRLIESHPIRKLGYFPNDHRFVPATLSLFDWFHPGLTRQAMEYGFLPWWTSEGAQQSFWRPLSSATHWLDYRWWPSRPLPMHLHNTLWFGAFLVVAWALYRGIGGRNWTVGLAALLLALNQENWQTLAWIAARNSLITALLVVLTLWLYHRRVRGAGPLWGAAALGAFGASLLAGEGAVTGAAYLFSYALFIDERPWKARLPSLAPFALVVIVWRLAYQALGFGVAHSGLYVDPGGEPLRYALNLLEWGPILIVDVFTIPILGKYASLAPAFQPLARGLSWVGLLALAAAFFPMLRAERTARFWALGLVLTVVPACATTVPDDRITLYAAIGFAPLVAGFLAGVVECRPWLSQGRLWRRPWQGVGVLLLAFHLLHPGLGHGKRLAHLFCRFPLPAAVAPVLLAAPDQELIVVNTPDAMYLSYLPFFLAQDGVALPAGMRVLSSCLGGTTFRRIETNTLVLVSANGPLVPVRPKSASLPFDAPLRHPLYKSFVISSAFRAEGVGFAPGDRIALPGMTVTVDRLDQHGLPMEVTITFARSLNDARYHWVFWDSAKVHYALFTPPTLGAEMWLPGPLPPCHDGVWPKTQAFLTNGSCGRGRLKP